MRATSRSETLGEYETGLFSLSDIEARDLQGAAGSRLVVTPGGEGQWEVRASSHVGAVHVPGLTFHVRPKIAVQNVLQLMTWSTHRMRVSDPLVGYQQHDELVPALAELFARLLESTLVRGVDHQYVETHEPLAAIRGRVDWPAQRRLHLLPTPVACTYDDWSMNTWANRMVKSAATTLLRLVDVSDGSSFALRRLVSMLDGVTSFEPADLVGESRLTRLNAHYEQPVMLARLILRQSAISHRAGPVGAAAFMVDMNQVYEDFVYGSLKRALRGVLDVVRQDVTPLGTRNEVPGEPDLVFRDSQGRTVFVADAKYKIARQGRGRSSDYYQLLAYCTSLGLPEGMLIYATHEGEQPSRVVEVVNSGHLLTTFSLNLLGTSSDMAAEVQRLARQVRAAAAGTSPRDHAPAVSSAPTG